MDEKLHLEVYEQIRLNVIYNNAVKCKIIWKNSGMEVEDIIQEVYLLFLRRGYVEKFDDDKSTLKFFCARFTNYCIGNLLRRSNFRVPLSDSHKDGVLYKESSEDKDDMDCVYLFGRTKPGKGSLSNIHLEKYGSDTEGEQQELLQLIYDFLKDDDLGMYEVFTGIKNRHEKAKELGLSYKNYCFHFRRKHMKLNDHLRRAGYDGVPRKTNR